MQLVSYLIAFLAGLALTVRVGANATLGRAVGSVSFAVQPISATRIAGALLLLGGVGLIALGRH